MSEPTRHVGPAVFPVPCNEPAVDGAEVPRHPVAVPPPELDCSVCTLASKAVGEGGEAIADDVVYGL